MYKNWTDKQKAEWENFFLAAKIYDDAEIVDKVLEIDNQNRVETGGGNNETIT